MRPLDSEFAAALQAHSDGDLDAAAQGYRSLLAKAPSHVESLHMLGIIEQTRKNYALAESLIRQAAALADDGLIQHNLATLLAEINDPAGAEGAYREALRLDPERVASLGDLAYLLHHQGRNDEAEVLYRKALILAPDHARSHTNFAHMLLRLGRWREAWPHLEYRLSPEEQRLFTQWPPWRGEPLHGKAIVVILEQGLGDMIQFARYVRLLRQAGAVRISLLGPTELTRLLATIEGVDHVEDKDLTVISADFCVYLLSLPHYFATTPETVAAILPGGLPLLRLPEPARRATSSRLKVGIFWAGGLRPDQPHLVATDARRSIAFDLIAPLLQAPTLAGRIEWNLLQRDRRPAELSSHAAGQGWLDPFSDLNPAPPADLLDTALIIQGLDLVIGVDSALIHLAASLAKPTWMLDRFDPCWRWTGEAADPWYPEVLRIIRQPAPGDWDSVLATVRQSLEAMTRSQ